MNGRTEAPRLLSRPHGGNSVGAMTRKVLLALMPGIALSGLYLGAGILTNCLLAVVFAWLAEALALTIRGRAPWPALKDGSAAVSALLFALLLPPFTPWWVTCAGSAFAILVAKHLFGGLGHNPFNPAMAGCALVLLCFPLKLAFWPDLNSAGREWIAAAYLAGGIYLVVTRVIRWPLPAAVLGSLFAVSLLFNLADADAYPPAWFHLFGGGAMLCAFFIATDPVTSATTPTGRILYGAGIGLLIYVIRTWGNGSDGVAFAVLLMNGLAPLIDHYTRPRAPVWR